MKSNFLNLNGRDFAKGLALSVIIAGLGIIQQALSKHGFDFASYDWATIVNVVMTAFVGYLGKNLVSDENDRVLGKF